MATTFHVQAPSSHGSRPQHNHHKCLLGYEHIFACRITPPDVSSSKPNALRGDFRWNHPNILRPNTPSLHKLFLLLPPHEPSRPIFNSSHVLTTPAFESPMYLRLLKPTATIVLPAQSPKSGREQAHARPPVHFHASHEHAQPIHLQRRAKGDVLGVPYMKKYLEQRSTTSSLHRDT